MKTFLFRYYSNTAIDKTKRNQEKMNEPRLNASWKISRLAVNGQSFLVIDGYLVNLVFLGVNLLSREGNSQTGDRKRITAHQQTANCPGDRHRD